MRASGYRASAYVGRVGGLAVALGVGMAVAVGGAASATADPTDDSAAGGATAERANDSVGSARTSRQASVESGSKPARTASKRSATRVSVAQAEQAQAPDLRAPDIQVSLPTHIPASVAPVLTPPVSTLPGATMSAAEAVAVASPPARALPQLTATGAVSAAVAAFFGLGPGTGSPGQATTAWVVAAGTRRDYAGAKTVLAQPDSIGTSQPLATGNAQTAAQAGADRGFASVLFNETPTMHVTQNGQGAGGTIRGDLGAADGDGNALGFTVTGAPTHGTVVVSADGSYTYTPAAGFARTGTTDTFTVTASDASAGFHIHGIAGLLNLLTFGLIGDPGHTSSTTVAVTVTPFGPPNNAPTGIASVGTPNAQGIVTGTVTGADADGDALTFTAPTATAKGTVTVSNGGAFTYTPTSAARHGAASLTASDADKVDSFTVTVSDGYGGVATVPVTVSIASANAAPVAGTPTAGVPNSSSGVVTGSISVTDTDRDALRYSGTAAKGSVTFAGDGTFSYTPTDAARHAASATGATTADKSDVITVTVSDGYGGTVSVPVTVTIGPKNAAPVGGVPAVSSPDGAAGTVSGRVVATDSDGDALIYSGSGATTKGSVVVAADGTFTFTPTAQARHAAANADAAVALKSDTFMVTVTDGHGATVDVPVTVSIGTSNSRPVLGSPVVGSPNSSTGVVTGSVAATDVDNDTLTFSGTQSTAKGSVVVNSNGTFAYTPSAGARHTASSSTATVQDKTDSFVLTVSDGHGGTSSVAVSVQVGSANQLPGSVTVNLGGANALTGGVDGTVSATDGDNDTLTFSGTQTTAKGSVVVNSNGTFTYTPSPAARHAASALNAGASVTADDFVITVSDSHGGTVAVPVTVAISPKNTAPATGAPITGIPEQVSGVVTGSVIAVDADGDALSFSGSGATPKGNVVIAANGAFTYTPSVDALHAAARNSATAADRVDSFTASVADGHGGTTSVVVTVPVGTRNSVPVVGSPVVGVPNSSTGVVTGTVSATDADNDSLTFSGSQSTAKGSVVVNSNGTFTYTPTASARHAASSSAATALDKADSFTVTVSDGHGGTSSVAVSVTVGAANQTPSAGVVNLGSADVATGAISGTITGADPDSDALTFNGTQTTAKGTVVVNSNGTFTYTPLASARHAAASLTANAAVKTDDFVITMSDGHGGTVSVPVTVTISPKNAAPVAGSPASGSPNLETGAVSGSVIAVDADGDSLTYTGSTTTSKGTVSVSSNGTFTYTPTESARYAAGASNATVADKTDTFTITIADGYGGTVVVPVSVTVSPVVARVTFNFVYGAGSSYWTPEAKAALEKAADILSSTIVVTSPVVITYNVVGTRTSGSSLANASTTFSSGADGFYGTVVQTKILTGVDTNGSAADGTITWNFAQPWSFTDEVSRTQYDATATALHEILHTFGILTGVGSPSNMDKNWTIYDSFLVTANGTKLVGTDYVYNTAYRTNLTGNNGGVYFGGANAVAAYGGPVPLYTPSTWIQGSSLSHLDPSNEGASAQVMNPYVTTGLDARELSPVEIGILKDLGYSVSSGTPISAFVFGFGFLLFGRRRR